MALTPWAPRQLNIRAVGRSENPDGVSNKVVGITYSLGPGWNRVNQEGLDYQMEDKVKIKIKKFLIKKIKSIFPKRLNLVIVIGGDGFMLQTAHKLI